jgi:two-component system NarL family response regulator
MVFSEFNSKFYNESLSDPLAASNIEHQYHRPVLTTGRDGCISVLFLQQATSGREHDLLPRVQARGCAAELLEVCFCDRLDQCPVMKTQDIRILLADDHHVVRIGLTAILNLEPGLTVVAEAEDGPQAIAMFRQHRPDVTLMDVRMPGMGGVETTAAIRKEFPEAKILMLTTYDGDEDIHRAFQAGASGYLLKNVSAAELVQAIKTVRSGERYLPAAVAQRLAERNAGADLTVRELDVLKLMVKGLSNREIGRLLGFSENTAKFHIKSILLKLDASDRTEAATAALQRGYLHLD